MSILIELNKLSELLLPHDNQKFIPIYSTHVCDFNFKILILFRILKRELLVPKTEFPELLVRGARISMKNELTVLIRAKSEFRIPDLIN